MLIGQFWGTSAAEGIPAPFCRCEVCREAREKGGVYSRKRTCFRLSDKIMIDLGADAVYQSERFGDLFDLEHVLVTHTHEDHFNLHMMMEAFWSRARGKTLHYYLTDKAYDMVSCLTDNQWVLKGKVAGWIEDGLIEFHKLEYGVRYAVDDIFVTPFRGNHIGNVGEHTALYFIELPDGRTMFYGLDTGPYFDETVEALYKKHIDVFVSESTDGTCNQCLDRQHLSIDGVSRIARQLYEAGTLTDSSRMYLTHINHGTSHGTMLENIKKYQFPIPTVITYDGIRIL